MRTTRIPSEKPVSIFDIDNNDESPFLETIFYRIKYCKESVLLDKRIHDNLAKVEIINK